MDKYKEIRFIATISIGSGFFDKVANAEPQTYLPTGQQDEPLMSC
jgi:hypothetical protein